MKIFWTDTKSNHLAVEAKIKSGSLITADYALEQGKDIYAVPGRMYDALSEGPNFLPTTSVTKTGSIHSRISVRFC